jgi:hypothetical protein
MEVVKVELPGGRDPLGGTLTAGIMMDASTGRRKSSTLTGVGGRKGEGSKGEESPSLWNARNELD